MEDRQNRNGRVRITPLMTVLALVALALLGANRLLVKNAAAKDAVQQEEIEKTVREVNDLAGGIQGIRDEARAALDPLAKLLEMDRRLEAEGLPPLGGKEFTARLTEENRKLVASGSTKYIDTCAQKGEVEKHLLYEGLHGPIQALPGWSKDWQTACITILPHSSPR